MAQTERPDAVLLDLAMPEVTGIDVLRRLKRGRRTRQMPVLVTSAYTRVLGQPEIDLASGVLPKPIDVDNLLAHMRRILGEDKPSAAHAE
jgi:CheY-like chemotaxis protein